MIEAQIPYLFNELSEVVRLFEGAESLDIRHQTEARGGVFYNRFTVNGELFTFENRAQAQGETEYKRYIKRFSKLALYRILSARFQKQLPWGALTGIRPPALPTASWKGESRSSRSFAKWAFRKKIFL